MNHSELVRSGFVRRSKPNDQPKDGPVRRDVVGELVGAASVFEVLVQDAVSRHDRGVPSEKIEVIKEQASDIPGEVRPDAEPADIASEHEREIIGQFQEHAAAHDRIDPVLSRFDADRNRTAFDFKLGIESGIAPPNKISADKFWPLSVDPPSEPGSSCQVPSR